MLTQSSSVVIPLHQPFPQTAAPGLPHNAKVALAYARAGFAVFPCNPVREPHKPSDRLSYGKAKKNPIGVDSWSREATTDEGQIRAWWQQFPDALVGLPMKQNRLLVIDADRHTETDDGVRNFAEICEGREERMPPHPVVSTDFQGEHHFFSDAGKANRPRQKRLTRRSRCSRLRRRRCWWLRHCWRFADA